MKDKDSIKTPQNDDDEKIHVSQSVIQTAREIQMKQLEEQQKIQQELERKRAEREKIKREEYERQLLEEKKELIRLKQGQVEKSEIIHEEAPEEKKLTLWQKITNFFYHNKWWLGIGVLIACIGIFLIYDLATKRKPDYSILMVTQNDEIGYSEAFIDYLESYCEDFNDDGRILASVMYIPYSDNAQYNYANGIDTKLTAEFQTNDAVIVLGGEKTTNFLDPEKVFVNLEELYPDNPNVDGYVFYLKDTEFAEHLGIPEESVTDDMFLAIRKPQKLLYSDESELQETYDKDFPIFDSIIKDLTK